MTIDELGDYLAQPVPRKTPREVKSKYIWRYDFAGLALGGALCFLDPGVGLIAALLFLHHVHRLEKIFANGTLVLARVTRVDRSRREVELQWEDDRGGQQLCFRPPRFFPRQLAVAEQCLGRETALLIGENVYCLAEGLVDQRPAPNTDHSGTAS